jgi:hypothetical protein
MNAFNPEFQRPSVEDIELGYRMTEAGHRIRLLKNMQGTHLKVWRIWNMVKTDIFHRGIPWVMLLLRHPDVPASLNVDTRSRLATMFAGLLALALPGLAWFGHWRACIPALALMLASVACAGLTAIRGSQKIRDLLALLVFASSILLSVAWAADSWALLPLSLIAAMVAATSGFYHFLKNRRGWAFALGAVSAQLVFYLGCVIAVPLGWLAYLRAKLGSGSIQPL